MGEAKRKRIAMAADVERTKCFNPHGLPIWITIARSSSSYMRQQCENNYAAKIAAYVESGKPQLCFNLECNSEMLAVPAVLIFLSTQSKSLPHVLSVCEQCSKNSDDELYSITMKLAHHLGLTGKLPEGHTKFELEIPVSYQFDVEGLPIVISGGDICPAVRDFLDLLADRKLSNFQAGWYGVANCHAIADRLYSSLRDIGSKHSLLLKRGSSALLRNTADSTGLHTWVEFGGWAIDAANGGLGKPVMLMPAETFYGHLHMTDIRVVSREGEKV
jgi:hypothetical protein